MHDPSHAYPQNLTMPTTRFLIRESYAGLLERTALTASGAAVFIPAMWLLVAARGSSGSDVLAFVIPLAIWLAAFLPRLRRHRWVIQTASGLLLMATPVVLTEGPAWVQPTIIGFAILVGVIFAAPLRFAVGFLAGIFLLDVALSLGDFPAVAFASGTPAERMVGPLMLVLAGSGLVLSMREWINGANAVDEYEDSIRQVISDEHAALRSRIAHDAVRRRVHETVLNTMNAIGLGLPDESVETARRSCARDLTELDVEIDLELDASVSDVVNDAIAKCSADDFTVTLECSVHSAVDGLVAMALRDAIVEAIRNVQRHSGVRHTDVLVREEAAWIVVDIDDDGVGVNRTALERFGLRNAMRSGIEAVGGTVNIEQRQGPGTRVSLRVPILAAFPASEYPVREFAEASRLGRVGLLGTPVFLVVTIGTITSGWSNPWPARISVGCLLIIGVLLVAAWNTRARIPLSVAGCVSIWAIALAARPAAGLCSNSDPIGWLLLAVAGGGAFALVLAQRKPAATFAAIAAIAAAAGWVVIGVPVACQAFPLLGAGVGLSYLVAVGVALWIADGLLELRRVEAMAAWEIAEREHSSREARVRAQDEWAVVDEQARGMLREIAEGRLDPVSSQAREDAIRIGTELRSRLTKEPEPTKPIADILAMVHTLTSKTHASMSASVSAGPIRQDPYPPALLATLLNAVIRSEASSVQVSAFIEGEFEEIVLACDGQGEVQAAAITAMDAVLEISHGDDETFGLVASLRRPASRWRQAKPRGLSRG